MGSAATILLVEDEVGVRELVAEVLTMAGYRLIVAQSGDEALRLLGEGTTGRIDLLLTDVRMPGLSGLELADEFVLARPGAKVLYLTGYPDDMKRIDDPRLHGKMLWKPFLPSHLTEEVAAALA